MPPSEDKHLNQEQFFYPDLLPGGTDHHTLPGLSEADIPFNVYPTLPPVRYETNKVYTTGGTYVNYDGLKQNIKSVKLQPTGGAWLGLDWFEITGALPSNINPQCILSLSYSFYNSSLTLLPTLSRINSSRELEIYVPFAIAVFPQRNVRDSLVITYVEDV